VKQDHEKLRSSITNSDRVLAEGRARLAALNKDLAERKVTAAQADEARRREESNIASMTKTLDNAKQSRANYLAASKQLGGDATSKRNLDAEISKLNTQIAQLERNVSEYNKALTVSRA
jgi:chromosome segregation ATPase